MSSSICYLIKDNYFLLLLGDTVEKNQKTIFNVKYSRPFWKKHKIHTRQKLFMNCLVTHPMIWKTTSLRLQPGCNNGNLETDRFLVCYCYYKNIYKFCCSCLFINDLCLDWKISLGLSNVIHKEKEIFQLSAHIKY